MTALPFNKISQSDWKRLFDFIPLLRSKGDITQISDDFVRLVMELKLLSKCELGYHRSISSLNEIDNFDMTEICQFFFSIIRSDRFIEGTLVNSIENDLILKLLTRLKTIQKS